MYGKNNMGRKTKDYTGFKLQDGYLEAIQYSHTEKKPYGNLQYYHTKCHNCGNVSIKSTSSLRSQKSCGCLLNEYREQHLSKNIIKTNQLPPGEAQLNRLFSDYKNRAKYKGFKFEITKIEFSNLIKQNCFYCGIEPHLSMNERKEFKNRNVLGNLIYNGVDRIDSTKGYIKDNLVPCCEICNKAKSNLDIEIFLNWVNRIKKHESKFKLGNPQS